MGAAEGQSDNAKGRRVIPRLWMTVVWCAFWVAGGIFMGVGVTFGNVDGGVVFHLVLYVFAASCFAWAGLVLGLGSFFVADHQVRSGWPRSRWTRSDTVEVVRPDVNPGLNYRAVVRQHNGSEHRIVTVNLAFGIGRRAAVWIERAMRLIHDTLDLDEDGYPTSTSKAAD